MLSRDEVMYKVKKLLALGASPHKGEAESALAKAHALMMQYAIEQYEIDHLKDNDTSIYTEKMIHQGKVQFYHEKLINHILNQYFHVQTISYRIPHEATMLYVFGTESNVEFAEFVWHFLMETFERLWFEFKKEHAWMDRTHARSYHAGVANGFESTLQREIRAQLTQTQSTALACISTELANAVKQVHPHVRTQTVKFNNDGNKRYYPNIADRGFADGKKIKVARPLEDQS